MASETIKRVRLDEVCEMNMGQSPDSKSYNQEERGLPFYQGNADFGVLHPSPRYWCDSPTKVADKDDILISVRAPIGALNIADSKCCIGRGLAALRPKACCDLWYLYFFLKSRVGELNAKGTGSTFKAINKKNLAETSVSLPPLPVQRRIAAVLDKISEMKRNAEARLQKLDLLVKARFNEMFERGVASMPPLRCDISSHDKYPVVTVGEVFQVGGPKRIHQSEWQDHGVPFLRISDLSERLDGNKRSAEHFISRDRYDQLKAQGQTPVAGDVLVTARGTLGRCYVVEEDDEFYFQDGMITWLSHRSEKLDLAYFLNAMKSESFKRQYEGKMPGSTVAYLSIAQLAKLKLPLPPLSLQRSFAAFVEKVEALKATVQKELEQVDLLYRAKLQEYFG